MSVNIDKIGMTTSLTCAIHCMIMPLLITILPYIGISFFASEAFEWILLLVSAILGVSSICMGYKTHRDKRVSILLSLGLGLLILGRFAHENDWGLNSVVILIIGGITLSISHWFNNKLCFSCKVCNHD